MNNLTKYHSIIRMFLHLLTISEKKNYIFFGNIKKTTYLCPMKR